MTATLGGGRETRHEEATQEVRRLELTVEVVAYHRDGRWYAEALNQALMAEAATKEDALRDLLDQLSIYVSTVVSHGWLDRLYRPASLRHRIAVHARVRLARLARQPALRAHQLVEA